jgi:cobaltochelatase CobT
MSDPFPATSAGPIAERQADGFHSTRLRAASDRRALRRRHHDARIHRQFLPAGRDERRVYEALEAARLDALGTRWLPGIRNNLETTTQGEGELRRWLLCEFGPFPPRPAPFGLAPRTLAPLLARLADQAEFAAAAAGWARTYARRIPASELQRLDAASAIAPAGEGGEVPGSEACAADGGGGADVPAGSGEPGRHPDDGAPSLGNGEYRAFDTRHDRVVEAASLVSPQERDELYRCLHDDLRAEHALAHRLALRMQRALMASRTRLAALAAAPHRARPFKQEREAPFPDTAVTLLMDCSSSMRGRPIRTAALVVDVVVQALERCNIRCEVLGYTTRWWDGGSLHEAWQRAGSPPRPGRLNALEHVVIKDASRPWRRCRRGLGLLLRPDFLKENIDGEAIQWAHHRLLARGERRRVLIVICDGLPMDEATLQSNPPDLLERHLHEVVEGIERRSPVQLAAIGIGHDLSRHYRNAMTIVDAEELAEALTGRLVKLLAGGRVVGKRQG